MEPNNHYCYLDTNTFLHYGFFNDIDWCNALNLKRVTLIICYPVLKELEHQKIYNPLKKLRERAAKVVKDINSRLNTGTSSTLRKNVKLEFVKKGLHINWDEEELSPDITDDLIVAYVINDKRTNKKIITTDPGLHLTAKGRGIECMSLPEEYKLEIKDERDKKIEKLQKQLIKKPKLQLKIIANGKLSKEAKLKLKNLPQIQEAKIEADLEKIKKDLLDREKGNQKVMRQDAMGSITVINFFEYKDHIESFVNKIKEYFKSYLEFFYRCSRIHYIKLVVLNKGNCPASDIEIILNFPNKIKILKVDDMPVKPTLLSLLPYAIQANIFWPEAVTHPIYIALDKKFREEEKILKVTKLIGAKFLNMPQISELLNRRNIPWNLLYSSRIKTNKNKLKHNDEFDLDIFIELEKNIKITFPIESEIKIDEISEIIKDKVIVKIENKK